MIPTESTSDRLAFLPPAIRTELDELARQQHRDASELVSDAVTAYINAQRDDWAAILIGLRQADAGEFATDAEVEAAYAAFR